MSHMKMPNKGPKIEPRGTLGNISLHKLYLAFTFTLCFLFERELFTNFKAFLSKPYVCILFMERNF